MATFGFIEKEFDSMGKCLQYVDTHFRQRTVLKQVKAIGTDDTSTQEIPRYYYRGESKVYPSTTSSMQRAQATQSHRVVSDVLKVVGDVDSQLQSWLGIDPMLSAGYLQHYGLPTELLDISSSLETASFFGSYPDFQSVPQDGCLCVFDTECIINKSVVIDLTQHPYALRPQLQSAYTFFHRRYLDIKANECVADLSLHWFYYKTSLEEKKKFFDRLKYLPSSLDDVTAGFIYMQLSNLAYKISDAAADFLVNKCPIPVVPIVIESTTGIAKTFKQANIKFDEDVERYNLYRILSNMFPDTNTERHGFNAYA
jgi:hypothetical protein